MLTSATTGGALTPNLNECNSTLTIQGGEISEPLTLTSAILP